MEHEAIATTGWLIDGFQTVVLLVLWSAAVVIYGLFWRSLSRPEADPIRPSGPLEQ